MIGRPVRILALLALSGFAGSASGIAEPAHAPPEWQGVWRLDRDAGASAVSALDAAQAHALLGTTLSLDGGSAALGGLACPSPNFQVSSESKDDFTADFRILPATVGITNDPVTALQVDCKNYAYSLVRLAPNRGLVIYQGHFFGAARLADQ